MYKKAVTIMMSMRERVTEGEKHAVPASTDRKMLTLSCLIRDNGQVCSRQIASNT